MERETLGNETQQAVVLPESIAYMMVDEDGGLQSREELRRKVPQGRHIQTRQERRTDSTKGTGVNPRELSDDEFTSMDDHPPKRTRRRAKQGSRDVNIVAERQYTAQSAKCPQPAVPEWVLRESDAAAGGTPLDRCIMIVCEVHGEWGGWMDNVRELRINPGRGLDHTWLQKFSSYGEEVASSTIDNGLDTAKRIMGYDDGLGTRAYPRNPEDNISVMNGLRRNYQLNPQPTFNCGVGGLARKYSSDGIVTFDGEGVSMYIGTPNLSQVDERVRPAYSRVGLSSGEPVSILSDFLQFATGFGHRLESIAAISKIIPSVTGMPEFQVGMDPVESFDASVMKRFTVSMLIRDITLFRYILTVVAFHEEVAGIDGGIKVPLQERIQRLEATYGLDSNKGPIAPMQVRVAQIAKAMFPLEQDYEHALKKWGMLDQDYLYIALLYCSGPMSSDDAEQDESEMVTYRLNKAASMERGVYGEESPRKVARRRSRKVSRRRSRKASRRRSRKANRRKSRKISRRKSRKVSIRKSRKVSRRKSRMVSRRRGK